MRKSTYLLQRTKYFCVCLITLKLFLPYMFIALFKPSKTQKRFILIVIFLFNIFSTAFAQEYKSFVAKSGDSVYSILRQNNLSPSKYVQKFKDLNAGKLGKNDELFIGRKYLIPVEQEETADANNKSATSSQEPNTTETTPNTSKDSSTKKANSTQQKTSGSLKKLTNDLYGEDHKVFDLQSNTLNGAIFYLVSGHGGPDPGAVSKLDGHSLCEDEYAYDVTLRLSRELESHGATVYMIIQDKNDGIRDAQILDPDKDEKCYPNLQIPINHVQRLSQRTDAINALYRKNKGKFQRAIIIHVDSRSKGKNIDVFFYHDERSTGGKKMATELQNTFADKYTKHQPNRGYKGTVSSRNLYVLKNTLPVATFIELGNINHTRDRQRLMYDSNRQALARWLSEGLILDYQNNKSNK